ncbi:hypothetical protein CsSME_00047101 [Camellia sinensis var. sinensis]
MAMWDAWILPNQPTKIAIMALIWPLQFLGSEIVRKGVVGRGIVVGRVYEVLVFWGGEGDALVGDDSGDGGGTAVGGWAVVRHGGGDGDGGGRVNNTIATSMKHGYFDKYVAPVPSTYPYCYLRAFCTVECRDQQIAMDHETEKASGLSKGMQLCPTG